MATRKLINHNLKSNNKTRHLSKSILSSSSYMASKTFLSFVIYQYQTNSHLQRRIKTMEISQSSNFLIASLSLSNRRIEAALKRHWRLVENGHDDSITRIIFDWLVVYLLYLWDVLFGIFRPILTLFLIVIAQLAATLLATTGIFYLIYVFITI